jgi:hypothetical protein
MEFGKIKILILIFLNFYVKLDNGLLVCNNKNFILFF